MPLSSDFEKAPPPLEMISDLLYSPDTDIHLVNACALASQSTRSTRVLLRRGIERVSLLTGCFSEIMIDYFGCSG